MKKKTTLKKIGKFRKKNPEDMGIILKTKIKKMGKKKQKKWRKLGKKFGKNENNEKIIKLKKSLVDLSENLEKIREKLGRNERLGDLSDNFEQMKEKLGKTFQSKKFPKKPLRVKMRVRNWLKFELF